MTTHLKLRYTLWLFFVYILISCNSSNTKPSDGYKELVQKLTDCNYAGSGFNQEHLDKFKEGLGQLTLTAFQKRVDMTSLSPVEKQKIANEFVTTYTQNQLKDDLLETLTSVYQPYINEEQLEDLVNILSTSRGKEACEHQKQAKAVFQMAMIAPLMQFVSKNMGKEEQNTKEIDKVEAKNSSASYKKAFDTYYEQLHMEDMLSGFTTALSQQLGKTGKGAITQQLLAFLKENLQVMTFNSYVGLVTEEDLIFLNDLSSRPSHKALLDAASDLAKNPVNLAKKLIAKYEQWMQQQLE